MEDARNTDHAWVESLVTHFHDESDAAFRWLEFAGTGGDALSFEWVVVGPTAAVSDAQAGYLKLVWAGCLCWCGLMLVAGCGEAGC